MSGASRSSAAPCNASSASPSSSSVAPGVFLISLSTSFQVILWPTMYVSKHFAAERIVGPYHPAVKAIPAPNAMESALTIFPLVSILSRCSPSENMAMRDPIHTATKSLEV